MSKKREKDEKNCDRRVPPEAVCPDYSKPEERQKLIDAFAASGIELTHDSPYWSYYDHPGIDHDEIYREGMRMSAIMASMVDPLNKDSVLASLVGPLFFGMKTMESEVGKIITDHLESSSPQELEDLFKRIVGLKRNMEMASRNGFAAMAYADFIDEFGFEPTKRKLKKFMLSKKKYKDMPQEEDKKGWTRMWDRTGLWGLTG